MARSYLNRQQRDGIIRRVILRPYRRGAGPTFTLTVYDDPEPRYRFRHGRPALSYRLAMIGGWDGAQPHSRRVIFDSRREFCPSPLHSDDADATMAAILDFITLRLGDADAEYFAGYTATQRRFADMHATALGYEAMTRFGER
jgi:hypothetical protein